MDIERGNIEIVFQKIPYMYVIKSQQKTPVETLQYLHLHRFSTDWSGVSFDYT